MKCTIKRTINYLYFSKKFAIMASKGGMDMKYPIDRKERITLGGLKQTIHIWGTKEENPVILFLHGGPGIPNLEMAMKEGYSTANEEARALGFGAGMGLPNMIKYTDDLRIDTVVGEGTTITMKVCF